MRFPVAALDAGALAALRGLLPPLPPLGAEATTPADATPRRNTPLAVVEPAWGSPDRAMLLVLAGPGAGDTVTLAPAGTVLGRSSRADLVLDEISVSRLHARILQDERGAYAIEDLGSTNGTFVGGRRVRRAALGSGDRVQIGRTCLFRFALVDAAEATFQKRLYDSAMRDALTHLANRRCLFERLSGEVEHARRCGGDVGLLVLDVDHFKAVNDTFGHPAGDRVLQEIARCGSRALRAGDLFARCGGEELAVVARCASGDEAAALAERLRTAIAEVDVRAQGRAITVTASVGVAMLSECGCEQGALDLYARADARLYAAKLGGRNRVSPPPPAPR